MTDSPDSFSDKLAETIIAHCQAQPADKQDDLVTDFLLPMLAEIAAKSLNGLLGKAAATNIKIKSAPGEDSHRQLMSLVASDLTYHLNQTMEKRLKTYPESTHHLVLVISALANLLHNCLERAEVTEKMRLSAVDLFADIFNKLCLDNSVVPCDMALH